MAASIQERPTTRLTEKQYLVRQRPGGKNVKIIDLEGELGRPPRIEGIIFQAAKNVRRFVAEKTPF